MIENPFGWVTRVDTMHQMRIQITKGRGQFLGLSGPLKSIVSHCCGVCSKEISNGIGGTAAADCIASDWLVSH